MTWFAEHLRERTRVASAIERRFPYLLPLLLSDEGDAELVAARVRNLIDARAAEAQRPERLDTLPYHVVLDPSNVCNLRCPLCVQATSPDGRRRTRVSRDCVTRLLDEIDEAVIRLDLFNWGEPLLNPAFCEIVEAATSRSIFTRTSSHFSHRRGMDVDRIVASRLGHIVASIDGTTQETYVRYRVNGRLDVVLENLAQLVAARDAADADRPLIEWQFLVFRHNVGEIERARDMAAEIGVDVFSYGGARGQLVSKVLASTPEVVGRSGSLLLEGSHPLSEYDASGQKRHRQELDGCRWLWGKTALHPDGGVAPCWNGWFQRHDVGDWTGGNFRDVWNGPGLTAARRTAVSGGDPGRDTMCDRCAFHRNFVPTPDNTEEPPLTPELVRAVAAELATGGAAPAPAVVAAIWAAARLATR